MLEHNNFSGKFHLDGIPAAVCGCCVTEDTFDNDAHETFDVPAEEQVRCSEHRWSVPAIPGQARCEKDKDLLAPLPRVARNADPGFKGKRATTMDNNLLGMLLFVRPTDCSQHPY